MTPHQSLGAMCRDALAEGIASEPTTEPALYMHLSRPTAAGDALAWVRDTIAKRDEQAWAHYDNGLAAIRHDEYAKAIYEFERAISRYEAIHSDVFARRSTFESDQPRRTLYEELWAYYYHLHESAVAWANSAVASQDEPARADRWHVNAHNATQTANRHTITWWRYIERWSAESG